MKARWKLERVQSTFSKAKGDADKEKPVNCYCDKLINDYFFIYYLFIFLLRDQGKYEKGWKQTTIPNETSFLRLVRARSLKKV